MVRVQDMGLTCKAMSTSGEQQEAETLKQDRAGEKARDALYFSVEQKLK